MYTNNISVNTMCHGVTCSGALHIYCNDTHHQFEVETEREQNNLCITTQNTSTWIYHTKFHDLILNGASVSSTSEVYMSAMLVLLMVGN